MGLTYGYEPIAPEELEYAAGVAQPEFDGGIVVALLRPSKQIYPHFSTTNIEKNGTLRAQSQVVAT